MKNKYNSKFYADSDFNENYLKRKNKKESGC